MKIKLYRLKHLTTECRLKNHSLYLGMYHIVWPDGTTSEWFGNKTNAKENIYAFEEGREPFGKTYV